MRPTKSKRNVSRPISSAAEVLESRTLLSSISLSDGVLAVSGGQGADAITVSEQAGQVLIDLNGERTAFDRGDVVSLSIDGGRGNDVLENRSSIDAVIAGGRGNDVIRGGSGNDLMAGGRGNDLINDFGGARNVLDGGRGNDALQTVSPGADLLLGGAGNDQLYAIVGAPSVVLSGEGRDQLIVRDGIELTDASGRDQVIGFRFDEPPITLRAGVLYVMGGGITRIDQAGGQLLISVNGITQSFRAKDVEAIAGIGGAGDDTFLNLSGIDSVYYGSAGNDILVGGAGDDLLKGGAGDDTLFAGWGGRDDLSGDAGSDVMLGIYGGRTRLRIDALDQVFADQDDWIIQA